MEDDLGLARLGEFAAAEDAAMSAARGRAGLVVPVPSPPVGALLAWVAGVVDARAVVEIGSGAGLTGLWLLRGMGDRGMVTSIEPDPDLHGLAGRTFEEARVTTRVRSIGGAPGDVLPRLADGGYELVVVAAVPEDAAMLAGEARRLLRPGGALVVLGLHDGGRALVETVLEDPAWDLAVLPLDGGVALGRLRP